MYATLAEESFAPIINRTSKHMAASIDPIHERQEQEQQRRRDRMAQLAADVELDRRREETFAPRTSNLPVGMSLEHRVPLADRRPVREGSPEDSPIPSAGPQVNAKSEAMVSGGARQHAEEGSKLRKQVQDLWAANSDGAGSMDRRGAIQCLRAMGVQSNSTTQKFLLALGFVNGDNIPRSEHVLHVEYDRFQKVLTAVLKAASAEASKKRAEEEEAELRLRRVKQQQQQQQERVHQQLPKTRGNSMEQHFAKDSRSRSRSPAAFPASNSRSPKHEDQQNTVADHAVGTSLSSSSSRKIVRVDHPHRSSSSSLRGVAEASVPSTRSASVRSASHSTTDSFIRNYRETRQQQQKQQQARNNQTGSSSTAASQRKQLSGLNQSKNDAAATQANSKSLRLNKFQNPTTDDVPFTFTPTINHNVVPKGEREPIHKRAAMSEETVARLQVLRSQQEHKEDDDCTFRPKTTEWTPSAFHSRQQQQQQQQQPSSFHTKKPIEPKYRSARAADVSPPPRQQQQQEQLQPQPRRNVVEDQSHRAGGATRTMSIGHDQDDSGDDHHHRYPRSDGDDDEMYEPEENHYSAIPQNSTAQQPRHHRGPAHNRGGNAESGSRRSHSSAVPSLSTSVEGVSSIATTMLGVTPGFESAVLRMRKARAEYRPKFEEGLRSSSSNRPTSSSAGGNRSLNNTNVNVKGQNHQPPPPPQCLRHFDPSDASPVFQKITSHSIKRSPTMNGGVFELSASPQRSTEVEPFHFRTSDRTIQREHAKPLLYVDVALPHGRTGRIGVHRGDTAQDLAIHFCATYSLDEATMHRLTDILQVKIDSVVQERTRSLWVC